MELAPFKSTRRPVDGHEGTRLRVPRNSVITEKISDVRHPDPLVGNPVSRSANLFDLVADVLG